MRPGESLTLCERDGVQWSVFYAYSHHAGHQLQLYVGSDAADWVSPLTLKVREVQGERDVRREVADAIEEGA